MNPNYWSVKKAANNGLFLIPCLCVCVRLTDIPSVLHNLFFFCEQFACLFFQLGGMPTRRSIIQAKCTVSLIRGAASVFSPSRFLKRPLAPICWHPQ